MQIEGSIPRGVLACFLPKFRDIQGKMPSPKVIWNAFRLVTVRVLKSYNTFYKVNPKVDDIPEIYGKENNGVRLLVLGTTEGM